MRIVFISTLTSHSWGGSEELWSQTAIHLLKSGHTVMASVHNCDTARPQIADIIAAGGVIASRAQLLRKNIVSKLFFRLRHKKTPSRLSWLYQICISWKPDLICFSDGTLISQPGWIEYVIKMGIPFINLSQANSEHLWPSDYKAERYRRIVEKSVRMCFVSKGNRDLFQRQIGLEINNSEVVRNPFNVKYLPSNLGWPEEQPFVMAMVGRMESYPKGHDILLQTLAAQKWKERPLEIHLYGKGYNEEGIKRMICLFNLEKTVKIKGHTNRVESIWKEAHALILPSRHEGLPLVIAEAMLCERTVITTDVAGNAELLEHGVTGFIAESPCPSALDRAMEEAWDARKQWKSMGMRAALEARRQIPENPPFIFAQRLLDWANDLK